MVAGTTRFPLAVLCSSAVFCCIAARVEAQVDAGPAAVSGFQKILWVRGGQKVDAAFATLIRSAGFNAVSISSGQDPTVPGRYGLRFYQDQICGKGILELRSQQYAPIAKEYGAKRDEDVLFRPAVLSSTETLVRLTKILSARLDPLIEHGPIAISLGDEISVTRHANPLDFCFAPASLRHFRAFLKSRHRTIDQLNESWKTDFVSFEQLRPFTADAIRARELGGKLLPANLAPWAAHREFMDAEFARVIERLVRQVRRKDANIPCGLTGLQPPSAYGGHDYSRLMPHLGFFEAYDIGGARELAMSLAKPGSRQIATLFPPKDGEDPRLVTARLVDMVAHGMWGTVVWSSTELLAKTGKLSAYGAAVAAGFKAIDPVARHFAGAEMLRSPVWIVESQASVRAWWMLDSRRDGATWTKRLSSYEATHSTSLASRHGWVRLLEDIGLQPRFVSATELHVRLLAHPPRLLVLPATIAMSDPTAAAIRHFVAKGGVVVADHTPGLYDQRLRLREKGALDKLFGVNGRRFVLENMLVHEGRPAKNARLSTGPAAAEKGLQAELADPISGFQVQMEATHGKGRAFYLNLAVCEYGKVRLEPKRLHAAVGLRKRVRHILREARVLQPVLLQAKGMPTCLERMVFKTPDGRRLLAVRVNALESPRILAQLATRGPHTARVIFRAKSIVVDLRTGKEYPAAFQHDLPLDPYGGLFLEVRKP